MSGRALEIVDAHHHLWDLGRNRNPWLCKWPAVPQRYGDYRAIRRDYLPADYRRDAGRYTVSKSVYVDAEWNPDDPVGETRWVHEVASVHGFPNAIVAQAWLDRPDAAEVLSAQAGFPLVRGIRHKPTIEHSQHVPGGKPRGSMSDDRWRQGYALLARFGLSFDLQVVYWHLPEAAELARDFPDTTIIVNHTGLPPGREPAAVSAWGAAMETVAERPNVALKISGLGVAGTPWTVESNRQVVLEAIRMFGADRCMFASNFPVDSLCGSFETIYDGYSEIVAECSEDDRRKLFRDNALRYYRIEDRNTAW